MGDVQARFDVGGMSCSFCANTIEKALSRTDGVEAADASLAHEEVLVQYDDEDVSEVDLKDTLRDLGYTIRDPDKQKRFEEGQAELDEGKRHLMMAGGASILTAALMGYMILVRGTFESTSPGMALVTLLLALGTMFGPGWYIKTKAYNSLRRGILNQHVLLEAGAFAGLLGGALGLTVFPTFPTVHFFAVSVFVTTYHILSEYASLLVRTRASRAVQGLLDLRPDTARRVVAAGEGGETAVEEVPVEELDEGDRVRIKPGERVPVDGEVREGESTVDESVATGESEPVTRTPGDELIGGSINQTGTLLVEVTATGEDAFLNQVAREVERARATKPGIIQLADRVLRYFVPAVLSIAALAFLFWLVVPAVWAGGPFGAGSNVQRGVFAALAVLVLGYPCALGMATPLALIRGGGEAARNGVLLRSGDAFQVYRSVDYLVLDKTGTITEGAPALSELVALDGHDAADVLRVAAGAELFSEHPLADAVVDAANEGGIEIPEPGSFGSVSGKGVVATIGGSTVRVGKPDWLASEGVTVDDATDQVEALQERGLTVSGVAVDGELQGLLGLGDEVKADAAETVERVKSAGITPVVLTGDTERTARAVADHVGIDRVLAEVLPDEKRAEIRRLQEEGHRVAMVGDGLNDAPALTQADAGIAIGAGTDIAIESADIVLLGGRLGGVMDAHEIARKSYRKTRQNLLAAFSFNGIGVAAATTGLVHPAFAMLAMVLSVTVVLANTFAGQLLSGGVTTEFTPDVDGDASAGPAR